MNEPAQAAPATTAPINLRGGRGADARQIMRWRPVYGQLEPEARLIFSRHASIPPAAIAKA